MRAPLAAALAGLCLTAVPAAGQPRVSAPVGPTVADRGSRTYAFESFTAVSADGGRRYRVQVARPLAPPPPSGRPAVYMLDGGAAVAALDEALLDRLAAGEAPVLAAIG